MSMSNGPGDDLFPQHELAVATSGPFGVAVPGPGLRVNFAASGSGDDSPPNPNRRAREERIMVRAPEVKRRFTGPDAAAEAGELAKAARLVGKAVGDVEKSLAKVRVLDAFGWEDLLETAISPGSEETLSQAMQPLRDFVESDAYSPDRAVVCRRLTKSLGVDVGESAMFSSLVGVTCEMLHSAIDVVSDEDEDSAKAVERGLFEHLKAGWKGRPFTKVPAWGHGDFNYRMGLNEPRSFDLHDPAVIDYVENPDDPRAALQYMVFSALSEHIAIERARNPLSKETFHRQSSLIEQRAGALFLRDRHRHKGRSYNSPSLSYFGLTANIGEVKKYLDGMLSLCVSEGYVVATDVISKDLRMLVEVYGENLEVTYGVNYADILQGLRVAVEVSYRLYADLEPGLTWSEMRLPEGKNPWTMLKVIERAKQKINSGVIKGYEPGQDPVMWSVGHGDSVFERFLADREGVKAAGYDVHGEKEKGVVYDDSDNNFARVFTDDADPEAEWGAFEAGLEHLQEAHGGQRPVLLFCGDVLHHLHADVRFKALKLLYDEVPSGGFLVIDEPTFCQETDQLSKLAAHPLDSTPHEMVALEDLADFLAYLTLRGGEIRILDKNPFAKKNDIYWRSRVVVRKGYPNRDLPFRANDPEDKNMEGIEDLLAIMPFRNIPGVLDTEERAAIKKGLQEFWDWCDRQWYKDMPENFEKESFQAPTPDDVRRLFLRWRLNSVERKGWSAERISELTKHAAPCDASYMEPILKLVGDDELMRKRFCRAGEIICVARELKKMGYEITPELLKRLPNWKALPLDKER